MAVGTTNTPSQSLHTPSQSLLPFPGGVHHQQSPFLRLRREMGSQPVMRSKEREREKERYKTVEKAASRTKANTTEASETPLAPHPFLNNKRQAMDSRRLLLRPKILCLHGFRTSGKIMKMQVAGLKRILNNDARWSNAEWIFPDAPHRADGEPDAAITNFFGKDVETFQWWNAQDVKPKEDEPALIGAIVYEEKVYEGIEESIEMVKELINQKGPIDMCVGFSQGANLATILTSMAEQQQIVPMHKMWKCVVLIAGIPARDAKYNFDKYKIKTPSIHIKGSVDTFKLYSDVLTKRYYAQQTRHEIIHGEGHKPPSFSTSKPALDEFAKILTTKIFNKVFYAFDFDGVICDSADETCETGYKAAVELKLIDGRVTPKLLNDFKTIRPILETGYEAILLAYMLRTKRNTLTELLHEFHSTIRAGVLAELELQGITVDKLKETFHAVRNKWVEEDEAGWLAANAFYLPVVESLKTLMAQDDNQDHVYIITTKHKDFAVKLLKQAGLPVKAENVFGLGSGKKYEVINKLHDKYSNERMCYFFEDRLLTLQETTKHVKAGIYFFLADWGYNSLDDRMLAFTMDRINVTSQESFQDIFAYRVAPELEE